MLVTYETTVEPVRILLIRHDTRVKDVTESSV